MMKEGKAPNALLNSPLARGAWIVCAGAFALIGCFTADFITYDDSAHIASPEYADATSFWDYFTPKVNTTYMPLTYISYKTDKSLHGWWAEKLFHSWAPSVRLDTLLIHAAAALFLWRALVRLRFSERRAFFLALIFVCHPTACETVCWASERKTAFAGMFGFAALWAFCTLRRPVWRWPLTCAGVTLALLGKRSALGLLPIMILIEIVLAVPALRARFFNKMPAENGSDIARAAWISSALGLAVLCGIAFGALRANLYAHSEEVGGPAGGSIFTALLTDTEIFSRYVFNLAFPFKLSAVYAVVPILGFNDPRAWLYGAALFGTMAVTIFFGRNRWRVAFGWFWFFAALGPNANLVAISHLMQDRYLYLATPGFLIAISEMLAGLSERLMRPELGNKLFHWAGAFIVAMCIALSSARGFVWRSTMDVFSDAVQKQPQAFFAHYGLGGVLYERYRNAPAHTPEARSLHDAWVHEFSAALECPDSTLFSFMHDVAFG